MAPPPLPQASQSSAPGQYLGYSLQQVRLCYHLLTVPDNHAVSLEIIDDVGIHHPDGTVVFEQTKSAISGNPATNKAEDLWKTFANWAEDCAALKIDPKRTRFRYYVSEGKPGSLMTEMDKATTTIEAAKVLKKIWKQFDDCDREVAWHSHLRRFLAAGDEACCAIIERCGFQSEADPLDSIRDRLNFLPATAVNEYCAAAIGLARNWIDNLIRQGQSRAIPAVDFRRKFWAFVRKHNFSNVLNPAIEPPDDRAIHATIMGEPLFVRQLKAVEAPREMLVIAVSDYMRTTADKVKWADDGTVYGDSFVELDDQLVRKHSLISLEIDSTHPQIEVPARGQRIYLTCSNVTMPLEGQSVPGYFISGAFNCLAHGRRIGWHRDYKTLFPPE